MALNDKTRKHNDMDFQKDLSEILTNAKIGLWAIEMDEGKEPRMYFDDVAREITGFYEDMTPEECYERWYKRIVDSAIDSVQASVKEMIEQGKSENTYAWIHPKKGRIYTRCGGSLDENYTAGTRLWGYHQDVTEKKACRMWQARAVPERSGRIAPNLACKTPGHKVCDLGFSSRISFQGT